MTRIRLTHLGRMMNDINRAVAAKSQEVRAARLASASREARAALGDVSGPHPTDHYIDCDANGYRDQGGIMAEAITHYAVLEIAYPTEDTGERDYIGPITEEEAWEYRIGREAGIGGPGYPRIAHLPERLRELASDDEGSEYEYLADECNDEGWRYSRTFSFAGEVSTEELGALAHLPGCGDTWSDANMGILCAGGVMPAMHLEGSDWYSEAIATLYVTPCFNVEATEETWEAVWSAIRQWFEDDDWRWDEDTLREAVDNAREAS